MQLARDDIIENSKYRNAKDYCPTTKVVALDHHEHTINELFDYIDYLENEWFTVNSLLGKERNLKNKKGDF
jgi:hypothetical protein